MLGGMSLIPRKSHFVRHTALVAIVVVFFFMITGCVFHGRVGGHQQSTSVVQFLYPGAGQPYVMPQIPTLRLPLRVGIAFVPSGPSHGYGGQMFSEARKMELMRSVAAQFRSLPFVQSIELVPTTYLRPEGGFENLDQLRAVMGVDVIALIAYDQRQATNDNEWSFAYWTIVGAYVVPATKNETHTLMEAVVYDIGSRSLLFRAPGVSAVHSHTTLVGSPEELQRASAEGLTEAAADLTKNLATELELFKVRAKEEPDSVQIEHKPGYTGAGSIEAWFGVGLLTVLFGRVVTARAASRRKIRVGA